MKKRFIPVLLLLVFLAFGAFAEPVPSNVAITIDGVRTAFFDEAGNYLSPLEENGILYVPVQQLAEGLGLDVTTNAEKLAVTLNGVRTAFFAEDGSYLPPLNVNGILYTPLDAFIESAGIAVEKEDGEYGFARSASASSAAAETAAPAPTEEPKQSALADLLTSETWVEVYAPEDKVIFNSDGTALNEYKQNGMPVSMNYKWEATGVKSFDLINVFFFSHRIPNEMVEQDGLLLFKTKNGIDKYFVRESDYDKAVSVVPTPTPLPTPTPAPSPTPLPTLRPAGKANDASDFIYATNGKEIQINKYIGTSNYVVVPEKIDGLPVTSIYDYSFRSTSIRSVHLPKTIKRIGKMAFYFTRDLEGVLEIPDNIEFIASQAFDQAAYEGIIIDSSFQSDDSFSTMHELKFIYIREGANPIFGKNRYDSPFWSCKELSLAIIPASVKNLHDKSFEGCNQLRIITPAGSAADTFAREHFIPVENDTYEQYVELFETTYPDPNKKPASVGYTVPSFQVKSTPTPKPVSSPTPKSTQKSTMKPSSKTTAAPSVHHIKITANGTSNVREKPDPKSTRVGHVKKDEVYELIKTASNGWFKIRLKDGKQGYVSGNMAEKID